MPPAMLLINGTAYYKPLLVRNMLDAWERIEEVAESDFVITRAGLVLKDRETDKHYYDTAALAVVTEAGF